MQAAQPTKLLATAMQNMLVYTGLRKFSGQDRSMEDSDVYWKNTMGAFTDKGKIYMPKALHD